MDTVGINLSWSAFSEIRDKYLPSHHKTVMLLPQLPQHHLIRSPLRLYFLHKLVLSEDSLLDD